MPPTAASDHRLDAFSQSDRAYLQVIRGHGVRRQKVVQPKIRGVDTESLRRLVQVYFQREARLHRRVPALGAAGRLVGERPDGVEAIPGQAVRHGLQGSGVVGARHPVAAVRTTVQSRLEMLRCHRTVAGEAGTELHEYRMPPPVAVEDFLPVQADLHGAARHERHLGHRDLVVEDVALASEASPDRARDDPDA